MAQLISGSGGGGGGGGGGVATARAPVEAADSLRSQSFARILDLIGEGEIEGLVNGMQSVYLDGTPLQNADGSMNFSGVSISMVNGTQVQSPLAGFPDTESETSVGVEVVYATPIIRTISDATVDAARVRIAFPGLLSSNSTTGDISGTSVQIAIDVQANGGGYVAQDLGLTWQDSSMPAIATAVGIEIGVTWSPSGSTDIDGNVTWASVTYVVQYRVVGAGSWTTHATDSLQSGDGSRIYQITELALALYEAQVVYSSGDGGVSLSDFRILTATFSDTITGKTTSSYQRAYRIPLTGSAPWDIRVRRLTADSISSNLRNKTVWDSFTKITDERFSYPNSAIVAISIDSKQFSTIPTRGYDMKLLRVQIPSNYNPVTRVYTGVWDGTFTIAWTDNPAWCFYDLLTTARYGLGNYLTTAQVDKWALYTIGQYCDELVPNGLGATEPRFTCNLYLQTREEAFKVIVTMASIFRGMAYWAAGAITAVQDAPTDPVYLFSEANVEGGLFTYSGSAKNARHTVALVTWNDPADGYNQKPEYVEDLTSIARYGVIQTSVTAVGCTSRGQAHRVGGWILYSERLETEGVMFRCGMDGIYLRPGDIFSVQDQHRAGLRFSGRILSATASSVTIDSPVTIVLGQTYTLKIVMPDGTLSSKTLTNAVGATSVFTVSVDYAVVPQYPSVWMLTSTNLSPQTFRALAITEVEKHLYEVSGIEHNATKYDFVEDGLTLVTPKTTTISLVPAAPDNLIISEYMVKRQSGVKVVVSIAWDSVPTAARYRIQWRRDSGNYATIETGSAYYDLTDALEGFYEVRVQAVNVLDAPSLYSVASMQILGKTLPPEDVVGFGVARATSSILFVWDAVTDVDLDHYELRYGATWEVGVPLGSTINTQYSSSSNAGGTFLIKAVDTTGNKSLNAAAVIADSWAEVNVLVTSNDATTWVGTKYHTIVDGVAVTLAGSATWNDLTSVWSSYTDSWFYSAVPYATGYYDTVPIDLTNVMTSRVEILPILTQVSIAGHWDALTDVWTTYTDPWTGASSSTSATYQIATSQDAVIWSSWQTFQVGSYVARAYKFRITLNTADNRYLPYLTSFLVTVDVPDRVLHFEDQATISAGTTLTFSPAFVAVQTVGVAIQGGAVGDTYKITAKSASGVTVTVYDSVGVAKASIIDLDAFGYGSI